MCVCKGRRSKMEILFQGCHQMKTDVFLSLRACSDRGKGRKKSFKAFFSPSPSSSSPPERERGKKVLDHAWKWDRRISFLDEFRVIWPSERVWVLRWNLLLKKSFKVHTFPHWYIFGAAPFTGNHLSLGGEKICLESAFPPIISPPSPLQAAPSSTLQELSPKTEDGKGAIFKCKYHKEKKFLYNEVSKVILLDSLFFSPLPSWNIAKRRREREADKRRVSWNVTRIEREQTSLRNKMEQKGSHFFVCVFHRNISLPINDLSLHFATLGEKSLRKGGKNSTPFSSNELEAPAPAPKPRFPTQRTNERRER